MVLFRRHIPIPNYGPTSISIAGLSIAGRITIVAIDNLTWTALPAIPLNQRNGISIQNISGENIKLQYDNTVVGWVGVKMTPESERFYNITDDIIIYAKSETGAVSILVEELS